MPCPLGGAKTPRGDFTRVVEAFLLDNQLRRERESLGAVGRGFEPRRNPCAGRLFLALVLLLLGASPASAGSIFVNNPSFEELAPGVVLDVGDFTCAPGCPGSLPGETITSDPIVGWLESDPTRQGTFRPGASSFPGGVPDGVNVAYLRSDSDMISQILSATLTSGLTYTLEVDVGDRLELTLSTFEICLLAGTAVLNCTSDASPPDGGFATATVSFTVPSDHPNLGDPLQIQIANTSAPGFIQLNVDNVRLTPEPATAVLLAIGMAALAQWRAAGRRR